MISRQRVGCFLAASRAIHTIRSLKASVEAWRGRGRRGRQFGRGGTLHVARPTHYRLCPCDMGPRVHRARLTAPTVTLSLPISPPELAGLLSDQNSDRRRRLPFRRGLALSIFCVHHPFSFPLTPTRSRRILRITRCPRRRLHSVIVSDSPS